MSRAPGATRNSRRTNRSASHGVPLAVAGIGALGAVAAAAITLTGSNIPEAAGPASEVSTPTGTWQVSLEGFTVEEVPPPPQVELSARGVVTELGPRQVIQIAGVVAPSVRPPEDAVSYTPPNTTTATNRYVLSPPALVRGDGTWRITWSLPEPPVFTDLKLVVASS